MEPAGRFRDLLGVGVALVALGVLADRTVPLVGAAVLGVGLVAAQWRAATEFERSDDALDVVVTAASRQVAPDERTTLTIEARLTAPRTHPVAVEIDYGPGVDGPTETVEVEPGATNASAVHEVAFPVAGQFAVPRIDRRYESADGLVRERVPDDVGVDVVVAPPEPRDVHVGVGGTRAAATYGEHRSGTTGSGIEVTEIREYLPGDAVGKIDWKATARLDEPHVREFEGESDRQTHLLVDARATMGRGSEGRTKLAFAREVALGMTEAAASTRDPVSLTVVDDAGVRISVDAAETGQHVADLKRTLWSLSTGSAAARRPTTASALGPADAQAVAQRLGARDRDSALATTLAPFFEDAESYVARLDGDVLFEAARRHIARRGGRDWTLVFTDDAAPHQTLEAVKLLARDESHVTVFLTPTVLFAGLTGREAKERYVEFEEFRRRLARLPRVAAYEVAPGDRVDAVLAGGPSADRTREATPRR
jgi:uncharacterized protein (DUF58 family)